MDQLKSKIKLYTELYKAHQDRYGFIDTKKCDSLLFTGLLGSVLPDRINITAARKPDGQWCRRPLVNGVDTCFELNNTKSSISRDMLLGLLWFIWRNKRLDLATDLWNYAVKNNLKMGSAATIGSVASLYLTPNILSTLALIIDKLGGKNNIKCSWLSIIRKLPISVVKNNGYRAHLDILLLALRAELLGKIENKDIVKYQFERVPKNALFSYVYERWIENNTKYPKTIANLMDDKLFPSDRLPTSRDRDTEWLWQRDPEEWIPYKGKWADKFNGCDFLFVAKLVAGK